MGLVDKFSDGRCARCRWMDETQTSAANKIENGNVSLPPGNHINDLMTSLCARFPYLGQSTRRRGGFEGDMVGILKHDRIFEEPVPVLGASGLLPLTATRHACCVAAVRGQADSTFLRYTSTTRSRLTQWCIGMRGKFDGMSQHCIVRLRGLVGNIHDASSRDRYYVLPALRLFRLLSVEQCDPFLLDCLR